MVDRKDARFVDIGLRLRAIREELQATADAVSKETGISRSYISDFERGFKLPTSKYLKYLSDHHNVNIDYIFSGENPVFRPKGKDVPPNFGEFQMKVDAMLHLMAEMPYALYAVLEFVEKYKRLNKELIEQDRSEKKTEEGKR